MLYPTRTGVPALVLLAIFLTASSASGQPATQAPKLERSNLEVQFHLLTASSDAADRNLPPALDPVVRQLKSTLPFTNYHLAANFTNRIRSGSTLEVRGVLSSEVVSPITNNSVIYDFTLAQVRVAADDSQSIEISKLRFGLRMPIIVGMSRGPDANAPGTPVVNYEGLGVTTELSVRDNSPTLVGTMTTSRPGQVLVLVVTIKRVA